MVNEMIVNNLILYNYEIVYYIIELKILIAYNISNYYIICPLQQIAVFAN